MNRDVPSWSLRGTVNTPPKLADDDDLVQLDVSEDPLEEDSVLLSALPDDPTAVDSFPLVSLLESLVEDLSPSVLSLLLLSAGRLGRP